MGGDPDAPPRGNSSVGVHLHLNVVVNQCTEKNKVFEEHFRCQDDSFLNDDNDNNVVCRLLEIHGDVSGNDDDNVQTLAEEDECYEIYGFWFGRPKGLNDFKIPKPPPLSPCHSSGPPMGAQLGGGGRRGSEAALRSVPGHQGTGCGAASDSTSRSLGCSDIAPHGTESNSSRARNSFQSHGATTVQRCSQFHSHGSCGNADSKEGIRGDGGQGRGDEGPRLSGTRGLLQSLLPGPQEVRWEPTDLESETLQRVCEEIKVQVDRDEVTALPGETRRFLHLHRPQGRFFSIVRL